MKQTTEVLMEVQFENSKLNRQIPLSTLTKSLTQFLEIYGSTQFWGEAFMKVIDKGDGQSKRLNLLKGCG